MQASLLLDTPLQSSSAAPPLRCRLRLLVELDRLPARGTLHLLDEPAPEADQVEHVAAAELLARRDVSEADAALQLAPLSVLSRRAHILELLQLVDELPPLVEGVAALSQPGQVVDDLAEYVDGQGTAADDEEEELHVDQEVTRVEDERDTVEHELLLEPLLPIAQLEQGHLVLEIVLHSLQQKSSKLQGQR